MPGVAARLAPVIVGGLLLFGIGLLLRAGAARTIQRPRLVRRAR
ncbi:MAG TPA: hypothetical protein VGX95_03480 [Xanthobacteraceae bacterium]|jgi:hypothetical protein|nr:hypothetical protein [Xanthobacteraceae bacterium]